jgi:hypothetical protein
MDAHSMPPRAISLRAVPLEPTIVPIVRALVLSLEVLLALLGAMICARRLSGSLVQPLHPAGLFFAGLLLAAWSAGVRSSLSGGALERSWSQTSRRALFALSTAAAVLVAIALCVSGTTLVGLVALWCPLIAAEVLGRLPLRRYVRGLDLPSASVSVERPPVQAPAAPSDVAEETEGSVGADVSQRLVRLRDAQGVDAIEGLVRVDFVAGERTAHGHVAFCPPFAATPQCDAEQVDGPAARIRVAQLLAHGVRFDVKLDVPAAEPTSVLVEFSARTPH